MCLNKNDQILTRFDSIIEPPSPSLQVTKLPSYKVHNPIAVLSLRTLFSPNTQRFLVFADNIKRGSFMGYHLDDTFWQFLQLYDPSLQDIVWWDDSDDGQVQVPEELNEECDLITSVVVSLRELDIPFSKTCYETISPSTLQSLRTTLIEIGANQQGTAISRQLEDVVDAFRSLSHKKYPEFHAAAARNLAEKGQALPNILTFLEAFIPQYQLGGGDAESLLILRGGAALAALDSGRENVAKEYFAEAEKTHSHNEMRKAFSFSSDLLKELALYQIEKGQIDEAKETVESLMNSLEDNSYYRFQVLLRVGWALRDAEATSEKEWLREMFDQHTDGNESWKALDWLSEK